MKKVLVAVLLFLGALNAQIACAQDDPTGTYDAYWVEIEDNITNSNGNVLCPIDTPENTMGDSCFIEYYDPSDPGVVQLVNYVFVPPFPPFIAGGWYLTRSSLGLLNTAAGGPYFHWPDPNREYYWCQDGVCQEIYLGRFTTQPNPWASPSEMCPSGNEFWCYYWGMENHTPNNPQVTPNW